MSTQNDDGTAVDGQRPALRIITPSSDWDGQGQAAALPIPVVKCPFCLQGADNCDWLRDVLERQVIGWHTRPLMLQPDPAALASLGENVLLSNQAGQLKPRLFVEATTEGVELESRLWDHAQRIADEARSREATTHEPFRKVPDSNEKTADDL